MKRVTTHLGDSHNFGRRVALRAGRIVKPRTVLWEWLLLSATSPLRRLLADAAREDGLGQQAFDFLPTLKFYSTETEPTGEVDRLTLRALPALSREKRHELAQIVGRSLALFTWLGLSDLHWENLVIGADARGRTVFGPLDVEMILADLSLPTETKLLPDPDPEYALLCQHACGVRRVLPYLGKPVDPLDLLAMIAAFRRTLALLERHSSAIADVFAALPHFREAPIRVCLRSTGDYVRARSEPEPLWPPLLDAEAEQLARGDIPYFFRLYGRRGIHYYENQALTAWKTLPLKGDVPKLDPILQIARGLRSPSRKKLREEGPFTLLGAFDHPSFSGKLATDELEVAFGPRALVMSFPDGEELHSRRNLSAFVSSVYQPCHCGEVRSVFVPERTVCDAKARR
jgi:hypothetical protein